jgi:hypothetical protein
MDQLPGRRRDRRVKGKFDYGIGKVVEVTAHHARWDDFASIRSRAAISGSSPRISGGEVRDQPRRQGADLQGEAATSGARRRGPERCGGSDPGVDLARQETFFDGKVFDREIRRAEEPGDPNLSNRMNAMNMPSRSVMRGLVPRISFRQECQDVDGRVRPGRDELANGAPGR